MINGSMELCASVSEENTEVAFGLFFKGTDNSGTARNVTALVAPQYLWFQWYLTTINYFTDMRMAFWNSVCGWNNSFIFYNIPHTLNESYNMEARFCFWVKNKTDNFEK